MLNGHPREYAYVRWGPARGVSASQQIMLRACWDCSALAFSTLLQTCLVKRIQLQELCCLLQEKGGVEGLLHVFSGAPQEVLQKLKFCISSWSYRKITHHCHYTIPFLRTDSISFPSPHPPRDSSPPHPPAPLLSSAPDPARHGSHAAATARGLRTRHYAVLALTFAAYAAFHASRKPPSIVKAVLSADWAPFSGPRGPHRLGELGVAFLSAYAAAMFAAGHLADHADLRRLLAAAMLASGASSAALGAAYFLDVHSLAFFLAAQVASGVVQSAGWPCVVAVVGNWFGHTSVGNIAGSVLAAAVLEFGWGWSFLVPAFVIAALGVVVLVFLVAHPSDAGLELDAVEVEMNGDGGEGVELLGEEKKELEGDEDELEVEMGSQLLRAIGFLEAWRLPGVAPYAFCLFFSKLVAYTFLYWLPFYIRHNAVAGQFLSHKASGILSVVFDIGGVLGGISAGFISDAIGARAVTSALFLLLSIPALIVYRTFGSL